VDLVGSRDGEWLGDEKADSCVDRHVHTRGVRIFHLHLTSAELQGPRIAHPALRADGREEERRTWRRRGVEEVSWALTGDNSYVLDRRFASGAAHSEGVQKVGLSN